ncbi:hypothetical protein FGO68_gene14270 [Halteria grandinella]|uniref:Uncharacterized protein n=1 Tax=Halteria grandinella TaxID=5974 RepID=A0A8J8P3Z0_HALGN|nr:hypothetical protein FGO68_gene14270 [Halteria grandinella]
MSISASGEGVQFTQGSALQRYNSELTRYIENIRIGRDDLHDEISKDEEEKQHIETEISQLSERLAMLTDALIKKYEAREEFDRTIQETEQAFMKILESSQTLLHVLKKEDSALNKRKINVSTRKAAANKENFNAQSTQSPIEATTTTTHKRPVSKTKQYVLAGGQQQKLFQPSASLSHQQQQYQNQILGEHHHHNGQVVQDYTSSSGREDDEDDEDEDEEEDEESVEQQRR